MSQLLPAPKGALFISVIAASESIYKIFLEQWILKYGPGTEFLPAFNPSFKYYSQEMGPDLFRFIYVSTAKVDREELVMAKIWATEYENNNLVEADSRKINIDPGLITLENMILSTGKPYSHRVYLGKGVYADLNYIFQAKSYQSLNWTYPDYAHSEKIQFFNQIRKQYLC